LTNTTVVGNSTVFGGGGLQLYDGSATLTNCTISGNSSSGDPAFPPAGGGIFVYSIASASLANTIVAGNGSGGDIHGSITGDNNLIGGNPLLGPLGNYGGQTLTLPLLPGSPAIGGGASGPGVPATDQRGVARPQGTAPDIGAFQSRGFTMSIVKGTTPQSTPINQAFPNPLAVTVRANYSIEPVGGGVVSFNVTPVGGASATLSAATATIAGGQGLASVMATANGTTGTYLVTASAAGAGEKRIALTNQEKPSLTVTTTADVVDATDGLTSLREAIAYANSHPGPDMIVLSPSAFGSRPRTITLRGGPLVLTDPATTTIVGPGARLLTIYGGGRSGVFDIEGGSLAVSGATITGGSADLGGGVCNRAGDLALSNVVIRGNRAFVGGGLFNTGGITMRGVTIKSNRALIGRNVFNTSRATLDWQRPQAAHQARARVSIPSQERTSWVASK
jgi:CSLREA domain-containing protein